MKTFTTLAFAVLSLSFVPTTLAHGRLRSVIIDGEVYVGPQINNPGNVDSVIRTINDVGPVQSVSSDDMSCGRGVAKVKASLSASAKAGSKIEFDWASGEASVSWPHNVGPMITYIASCGNDDCSNFNSLNAKWVKIDEAGREGNEPNGAWIQATTSHLNKTYAMNLPDSLPSGNYLMRHEIIALHNAQSQGGAEFYPSCVQLTVAGSKSGTLPSDTVTFPGGYKATDPGILINVYGPATEAYKFPGPAVELNGSSPDNTNNDSPSGASPDAESDDETDCPDDDSADNGSDDNSEATATITSTATATAGAAKDTVTVVVTVTAAGANDAAAPSSSPAPEYNNGEYRPRYRSRIMRRFKY